MNNVQLLVEETMHTENRRISPRFKRPGAMARELREAGHRHLRDSGRTRYASLGQWFRAALCLAGLIASATFAPMMPGAWALLPVALAGMFGFLVVATVCHDAAHGSFSRHKWVNDFALHLGFALFGISGRLWRWRHLKLHHNFANVAGTDIDGEGSLLVRVEPNGPWRWWHRYQAFYAPFLYPLMFLHTAWIDDWAMLKLARRNDPSGFPRPGEEARLILLKSCHVGLLMLAPYLLFSPPLWLILAGYLTFMGVASALFLLLAVGTHLSDEAEFLMPVEGRIDHDWAQHQLRTSVDWSPESPFAVALCGGVNAHTAHHLFPEFAHHHGPALSAIVAKVSAEHGERHNVTDFRGMIRAHLRHLSETGQRPEPAHTS